MHFILFNRCNKHPPYKIKQKMQFDEDFQCFRPKYEPDKSLTTQTTDQPQSLLKKF